MLEPKGSEPVPTKYVRLKGRAHIRMSPEGKIELYLFDPLSESEIINPTKPLVFTNIPSESTPLRFLSINIIAELSRTAFDTHLSTLQRLDPLITWERAEEPDTATMDQMNSTDPPRP